jgi:hypothetical protein
MPNMISVISTFVFSNFMYIMCKVVSPSKHLGLSSKLNSNSPNRVKVIANVLYAQYVSKSIKTNSDANGLHGIYYTLNA